MSRKQQLLGEAMLRQLFVVPLIPKNTLQPLNKSIAVTTGHVVMWSCVLC